MNTFVMSGLKSLLLISQGYSFAATAAGPFISEVTAQPTYAAEATGQPTYFSEATAKGG